MGSVRIKIVGDRIKIWRTEQVKGGKEIIIPETVGEIGKGEKFSPDLPAFMKKSEREQRKAE